MVDLIDELKYLEGYLPELRFLSYAINAIEEQTSQYVNAQLSKTKETLMSDLKAFNELQPHLLSEFKDILSWLPKWDDVRKTHFKSIKFGLEHF